MKKVVLSVFMVVFSFTLLYANENRANELVVVLPSGYIEFDPQRANGGHEMQIFTALYDTLVSYNPQSFAIEPALAESWLVDADKLSYTFTLRSGQHFSDGNPLNAYSFYRSFLRLLGTNTDPYTQTMVNVIAGARAYRQGELSLDDLGIKVIDENTLRLTLAKPTPYFLSLLTRPAFSPLSNRQLPLMWNSPLRIAYSGPYQVAAVNDNSIILHKNPFYYDVARVAIEQIRLQFSDDITTISHDFNRNAVDWVMGGNFDGSQVVENDAIKVAAQFGTKYYFFASNEPLFKQEALRLALIEAISSDKLRQNEAVEAQSLIPTLPHYPAVKAIKNNLSRAQRTLDELGYSDRSLLPPLTIASYSLNDSVALLIKTSWENLGFVVSLVSPSEEEDYFDFIRDNRPTLAVMLWNGDFLDPTAFLNMWRSDSPFNFSQFNSSVFDSFLDAANYSSGNERLKMLSDAESLLIKGGYLVAVGHLLSYNLINTNVIEGWYDNPLDIHYFKYLSFRKNKALAGGIEAAL